MANFGNAEKRKSAQRLTLGLCSRVRQLRIEKEMTQQQLAGELDIAVQSVVLYESVRAVPPVVLVDMAAFFNVSTDYLLGLTPHRNTCAEICDALKGASI